MQNLIFQILLPMICNLIRIDKNKELVDINQSLNEKLIDTKNKIKKYDNEVKKWKNKFEYLKKLKKKSENGNFSEERIYYENIIQDLQNDNEQLKLTKQVYLDKIDDIIKEMKILDQNYYIKLKENHDLKKKLNEKNENQKYFRKSGITKTTVDTNKEENLKNQLEKTQDDYQNLQNKFNLLNKELIDIKKK